MITLNHLSHPPTDGWVQHRHEKILKSNRTMVQKDRFWIILMPCSWLQIIYNSSIVTSPRTNCFYWAISANTKMNKSLRIAHLFPNANLNKAELATSLKKMYFLEHHPSSTHPLNYRVKFFSVLFQSNKIIAGKHNCVFSISMNADIFTF